MLDYARLAADRWIERAIKAKLISESMLFVSNSRYPAAMGSKWLRPLTIGVFQCVASALFALSVEAAALSGTYITTADVSLRSGPGVSYPVVTTLPKGIKIDVVGRQVTGSKWSRSTVVHPAISMSSSPHLKVARKTARRPNRSSQALTAL